MWKNDESSEHFFETFSEDGEYGDVLITIGVDNSTFEMADVGETKLFGRNEDGELRPLNFGDDPALLEGENMVVNINLLKGGGFRKEGDFNPGNISIHTKESAATANMGSARLKGGTLIHETQEAEIFIRDIKNDNAISETQKSSHYKIETFKLFREQLEGFYRRTK